MSVGPDYWYVSVTHRFTKLVVRSYWGHTERLRFASRSEITRGLEDMLRKITAEERVKRSSVRPDDADMQKRFPNVFEYLVADTYPDGQVRQRSTVMLIVDADMVKLCLNDKDNGQSLWVSGTSLANALKALEAAVTCPTTVWRENKQYEPPVKKKPR